MVSFNLAFMHTFPPPPQKKRKLGSANKCSRSTGHADTAVRREAAQGTGADCCMD